MVKKEMYVKLNASKFALAWAIVIGAAFLISALASVLGIYSGFDGFFSTIYGPFGYTNSVLGAILVGVYAFVDMYIGTWIFAKLYNRFIR